MLDAHVLLHLNPSSFIILGNLSTQLKFNTFSLRCLYEKSSKSTPHFISIPLNPNSKRLCNAKYFIFLKEKRFLFSDSSLLIAYNSCFPITFLGSLSRDVDRQQQLTFPRWSSANNSFGVLHASSIPCSPYLMHKLTQTGFPLT